MLTPVHEDAKVSRQELVGVMVATYQSVRFVEETLESIKAQTYSPLELIITDDGSTDETIAVVSEWLAMNQARFVRTELLTVERNSGVSANCNRGIQASQAEWIKMIAGDDILLPNCISDNMAFVATHPGVRVLFSYVRVYQGNFSETSFLRTIPGAFPASLMGPEISARQQYEMELLSDRIHFTPSYFFYKPAIAAVGYYDEGNRLVEDYPMWIKLTRSGVKLYFMDRETVGYRQHPGAIINNSDSRLFPSSSLKLVAWRRKEILPLLPWNIAGEERWVTGVRQLFERLGRTENNRINAVLYRLATVWLNPYKYFTAVRVRISEW